MTKNIAQLHKKVAAENNENQMIQKQKNIRNLVLAEITEGVTPIVFAISFAMAYYGPNSTILGNVRNDYWEYKKVNDVGYLFLTMSLLFVVDVLCVILNSLILLKITDVNLYQEIGEIMKKYWFFIAVKYAMNMSSHFASKDINLGMDATGEFGWITNEGRFQYIGNSTDLSEGEKAELLLQ